MVHQDTGAPVHRWCTRGTPQKLSKRASLPVSFQCTEPVHRSTEPVSRCPSEIGQPLAATPGDLIAKPACILPASEIAETGVPLQVTRHLPDRIDTHGSGHLSVGDRPPCPIQN